MLFLFYFAVYYHICKEYGLIMVMLFLGAISSSKPWLQNYLLTSNHEIYNIFHTGYYKILKVFSDTWLNKIFTCFFNMSNTFKSNFLLLTQFWSGWSFLALRTLS